MEIGAHFNASFSARSPRPLSEPGERGRACPVMVEDPGTGGDTGVSGSPAVDGKEKTK